MREQERQFRLAAKLDRAAKRRLKHSASQASSPKATLGRQPLQAGMDDQLGASMSMCVHALLRACVSVVCVCAHVCKLLCLLCLPLCFHVCVRVQVAQLALPVLV